MPWISSVATQGLFKPLQCHLAHKCVCANMNQKTVHGHEMEDTDVNFAGRSL